MKNFHDNCDSEHSNDEINCDEINYHECDDLGRTFLMRICMHSRNDDNLSAVEFLLRQGINANILDVYDKTVLHYALNYHGNLKIIELLAKHMYSKILDEVLVFWSMREYSPDTSVAKILLDYGASVCCMNHEIFKVLKYRRNNASKILKFLLENGFDVNVKKSAYNLLEYELKIFGHDIDIINKKIITLLLNYGCDYTFCGEKLKEFDFARKIIHTIEFSKSYFSTIRQDLQNYHQEMIYRPGNLRSRICEMNWNLCGDMNYRDIMWHNINVCKYFGIIDDKKLTEIVFETHKCQDNVYDVIQSIKCKQDDKKLKNFTFPPYKEDPDLILWFKC